MHTNDALTAGEDDAREARLVPGAVLRSLRAPCERWERLR